MPRFFLLFLLSFPLSFWAQFPLQLVLNQLVQDPQLVGTKWSICAVDLTTGDTLAAYLPTKQLPGASITKLVSTAAALEILGPNYQAKTQLFLDGELKSNGVFDGDILSSPILFEPNDVIKIKIYKNLMATGSFKLIGTTIN